MRYIATLEVHGKLLYQLVVTVTPKFIRIHAYRKAFDTSLIGDRLGKYLSGTDEIFFQI